jgi:hypothetical protein
MTVLLSHTVILSFVGWAYSPTDWDERDKLVGEYAHPTRIRLF